MKAKVTGPFRHHKGNCWTTKVDQTMFPLSDAPQSPTDSCLVLEDNDGILGPAHSFHDAIANTGGGAYSHWNGVLFFSSRDNSDPNTNNQSYFIHWDSSLSRAKNNYSRNELIWTPELVTNFWDAFARSGLDDELSFGKNSGAALLDLVKAYISPNKTYLDFGAGSGHFLQHLLDRGLNAVGFDPSPNRQKALNNLTSKATLSKERTTDRDFDVVFLMEVIEHILDQDFTATLTQAAKFVKPGGHIVVTTPNDENLRTSSVYCPISEKFFHPWQHVRSFSYEKLIATLQEFGFLPEFVALADFSADVFQIEELKALRRQDIAREKLIDDLLLTLQSFPDNTAASLAPPQKNSSLANGENSELSNFISATIERLVSIKIDSMGASAPSTEYPNLRIGKETTIVYVAKKTSAPPQTDC